MYLNTKIMQQQNLCKRKTCDYFSKSTKTCDHRLITGKGRGCPINKCDKWKKPGKKRTNTFNKTERKKRHEH